MHFALLTFIFAPKHRENTSTEVNNCSTIVVVKRATINRRWMYFGIFVVFEKKKMKVRRVAFYTNDNLKF